MSNLTPGERLRAKRKEHGLTAAELGVKAAQILGRGKPVSPSAIRNQENGTNGIPYSLADAYSQILRVPAGWLLFGRDYENSPASAYEEAIAEAPGDGVRPIACHGIITAGWLEATPAPPDHERFLFLEVAGYWEADLSAYEVVDDSLAPTYPKGTHLITIPAHQTEIRDGDHVIVYAVEDDGVILHSIREVRRARIRFGGADLVGIGANPQPTLDWFEKGVTRRLYPDRVVVANYRQLPRTGRPLGMPHALHPDRRLEADEALDAEENAERQRGDEE